MTKLLISCCCLLLLSSPVYAGECIDDFENGNADGVEAECKLSERRVRVRARCVINAAGPWVDRVHQLEDPQAPARLHLSKGIHVVLPAERLPVRNIVILNAADRRSIFVIRRGDAT